MKSRNYFNTAAVVFAAVAFVHLLRIVNSWDVVISDYVLAEWASWVAVLVGGYLSYWGFKLGQ